MRKSNPWMHPFTLPRVKGVVIVVLGRIDTTHSILRTYTAFYDDELDCFATDNGDVLCIQAWRRFPEHT